MMKTKSIVYLFLAFFTIGFILQACTVVGMLIGSSIDKKKGYEERVLPIGEVVYLEKGTKLHLLMKDATTYKGTYDSYTVLENGDNSPNYLIGLNKGGTIIRVKSNDIDQVVIPKRSPAKTTGIIIGAVIDVGLVITYLALANQSIKAYGAVITKASESSCPYFYSYDGTEYILNAEPLGGAIWQGGERTDWEVLQHIAEKNDAYLIRITNELEEVEYINEVKLEVVDHPKGTKVYPDFYGDFHLIGQAKSPVKATGVDGANLLPLLKAKDDYCWIANPLDKSSLQTDERTSVVLEYERPAGAKQVKLHFNVQNSLWASSFLKEFLKLYGEELDDFYTGLNASTEQSEALIQLMIREGMLDVKVWDGQQWLDGGFIWGVGPLMPKDKVLALDLSRIQTSNLKIKLEAPPAFWAVNSVLADYSTVADFSRQEITASYAANQLGEDISGLLLHADDQYYVMPDTTCSAELSFPVPPVRKGYERTVLLKARGYYHIKLEGQGPVKLTTIQRIQSEPGYLAQYANELFEQYAKEAINQ
jgi:hypothetical protein